MIGTQKIKMKDPVSRRFGRLSSLGSSGKLLPLASFALLSCDVRAIQPDPNVIDLDSQLPFLAESMTGATVNFAWAYDSWMWEVVQFGDEANAVGLIRWQPSARSVGDTYGVSGGLTGGWRVPLGPDLAHFNFLQTAVATAHQLQERLLAGDFVGEIGEDPANSAEYARASLYKGFAMIWSADLYCEIAFLNRGPLYQPTDVYALVAEEFGKALSATNAEPSVRQAALMGLARAELWLGNDEAAADYAAQVDPGFEFVTRYGSGRPEEFNHIWFRFWSWGEHSFSDSYRALTLDDTGIPDPRLELAINPVPPRGDLDDVYAPLKVSSPSSPLRVTSGVEARYILAEVALNQGRINETIELINAVRAQRGVEVVWSPVLATDEDVRLKLIDERRRALSLEGVRLGDIRRYENRYGLDFWRKTIPQEPHHVVEHDVKCMPLPARERENNPGLN